MFIHNKRLQYTVRVARPNPGLANLLLEQFGGAQGELAAAGRYFTQGLSEDDPGRKDLLMDIATEELSHLEIVGSIIVMLNKGAKGQLAEGIEEEGELYRSLNGAGNDSHITSLLYGAGNDHDGARLDLGVQRLAFEPGSQHRVSVSAGVSIVNRNYNQTYFGVTLEESVRSRFTHYEAGGGLQEAHVGVRWNWALSPSWMLTSNLQVKGLLGNAAKSPLVERSTNMTVSTAFAYRF